MFGRDPHKTARVAGQFGFASSTEMNAAFADPSFDLVDICLPTALHAEYVLRALELDLLCTKPGMACRSRSGPWSATGERGNSEANSKVSMAASAGKSGWSRQVSARATKRFHEAVACSSVRAACSGSLALEQVRVGDACKHEVNQLCDLVLSDPFHAFPR
ncbi:Gfo/Idh/MocA family oxidoreductase [Streptomyces hundungensis]|uniref:Gfo/Idh/MocA family oxidoreductase n=1 Tax=Streptomyces hundungensis TaxID=1077946 RepID=UPI0033DB1620